MMPQRSVIWDEYTGFDDEDGSILIEGWSGGPVEGSKYDSANAAEREISARIDRAH